MLFIFTPCRLSFAACVCVAFFIHPDEATHIHLGEPPRPASTAPQQWRPQ